MWSGPRNLSTAMMYSFAQRSDCEVWDEPFYAAYLNSTQLSHPMGSEIMANGICEPSQVIAKCTTDGPDGKPLFYQKHMTQHMVPSFDREWILSQFNVFLIRHPARVLASYAAKRDDPTLEDIGFSQQADLVEMISNRTGDAPLIVDSQDIRENPERMLRRICKSVAIDFDPKMLRWPKGGNPKDGIWARHWYASVWNSTGFSGCEKELPVLPRKFEETYKKAKYIYDRLAEMKVI